MVDVPNFPRVLGERSYEGGCMRIIQAHRSWLRLEAGCAMVDVPNVPRVLGERSYGGGCMRIIQAHRSWRRLEAGCAMVDVPNFPRVLGERSYEGDARASWLASTEARGTLGRFAVSPRALLDKPAVAPFSARQK